MNSYAGLAKYILRMSRPRFWFYLAGPVIVGISYGATGVSEFITVPNILIFLYFLIPANVYLYGVNDIFDKDIDEHNPKKSESGKEVIYKGNRIIDVIVAVAGVTAVCFFIILSSQDMIPILLFLFLGFAYSAPPFRFKTTPILDSVTNGLYILPGISAYIFLSGDLPPVSIIAGAWLWSMSMHTFSAIPDIEPDREAGIVTTATYLGERSTFAYCGVIWILSAVLFTITNIFFAVLFVYPAVLAYIYFSSKSVSKSYWWFPYINVIIGMILSLGGIYNTIYGQIGVF